MSELQPLVDPCVDRDCRWEKCEQCGRYHSHLQYHARLDERTISGPEFYAQGFEVGVQAERNRIVEWLEKHTAIDVHTGIECIVIPPKDWQALKGESDACIDKLFKESVNRKLRKLHRW